MIEAQNLLVQPLKFSVFEATGLLDGLVGDEPGSQSHSAGNVGWAQALGVKLTHLDEDADLTRNHEDQVLGGLTVVDEVAQTPQCQSFASCGHGVDEGKQVFFGARESLDLGQLVNYLDRHAELPRPVAVLGASYGAALALKWAGEDSRLERVIALTPYAELAPAVLAIRDGYAGWSPRGWVQRAAARLPAIVGVGPGGLDPAHWLTDRPVSALFIATDRDPIAPPTATLGRGQPPAVQPCIIGNEQARPVAAIDEPQPHAGALFPAPWRDALAA